MNVGRWLDPVRAARTRLARTAVRRLRVPPPWVRYRWAESEPVDAYIERIRAGASRATGAARRTTIHPPAAFRNPLPRTVPARNQLPDDRGWWGYSFRDVPHRQAGETFLASLPDCRVVHYRRRLDDQFYPAIVNADHRGLELREIRYRPEMAPLLTRSWPRRRLERATWILERVFHNHSHWLTAHLPKLILLKERGLLDDVILPDRLTPVIEASLRMLGIDPAAHRRLEPGWVTLEVDELTILGTDRFRPELLRSVQRALVRRAPTPPVRRIFISRANATRRRLLNEESMWSVLEDHGFERVLMEELPFDEQVELMAETAILFSIHGAGLTNMMFCHPGTHVVELADLSFPNPNFYAVAAALGHPYWVIPGTPIGDVHPLHRDLEVDLERVRSVLPELLAAAPQRAG